MRTFKQTAEVYTYLRRNDIQGLVGPPNIGISVPSNIWISSNVQTTFLVNL